MIPQTFVQELLTRADVVEIVGRRVQLKKSGVNYKGLCPFHGEKTPSFTVSATRQTYHCFGCGAHGNAIGFLMEHSGMSFLDAVRDLAQMLGMQIPHDEATAEDRQRASELKEKRVTLSDVLARACEHYRDQLKANPRAIDYLRSRGLTGEVAARFGMGYSPENWRGLASVFARYDDPLLEESGLVISNAVEGDTESKRYDRFRDRIMFPIRSAQGDVIGFGGRVLDQGEPKYLNSPETPLFVKGRELYGLYEARTAIREQGYVLVVEGYMDVVALAQLGLPNAVATLGTACTPEHVQKLFRFTDSVVFSFDGDAAGRRAAGRALEASLPHANDTRSVRFLLLPAEHDPDSFLRQYGADVFERQVAQSVPLSRQLIEATREGCDLANPEGRARLLATARPLWTKLPDGALKRQLLLELARLAELSSSDLEDLWQIGGAGRGGPALRPRPKRFAPTRPRTAPASPADHALRMLLLNIDWWDRLDAGDHELMHSLPSPHGELLAWLERHLAEHGPTPWSALHVALEGTELLSSAQRLVTVDSLEDEMTFGDLRHVLDGMWIERLGVEQTRLAEAAAGDPDAMRRWRELEVERRRRLEGRRNASKNNQPTS